MLDVTLKNMDHFMTPTPTMPPDEPDRFVGPGGLAHAVLQARVTFDWDQRNQGDISTSGIRRIIHLAYAASLISNEGRYPRMTLFVPARGQPPSLHAAMSVPLDGPSLRRLGPVFTTPQFMLVVEERGGSLQLAGIAAVEEFLTAEPLFSPSNPCRGLIVEVNGPGDIRAGEWGRHRLVGDLLYQEMSYLLTEWFEDWSDEAAVALLGREHYPHIGLSVGHFWQFLVRKVIRRRHGGCFVILPEPSSAPIRHAFTPVGCDLGATLAAYHNARNDYGAERTNRGLPPGQASEDAVRHRLDHFRRLHATLDVIVQFAATDGCVVFDRRLNVHSFGSMIEAEASLTSIPCYWGDSTTPLDETALRAFGARRRSAVRLCQSCPGALAFVISQDGDLRAVVNRGGAVRLYEHLPPW